MNTEYINKIIGIGQKGTCTDQELSYFLPNLPDIANKELLYFLRNEYGISTQYWTRRDILNINTEKYTKSLKNEDKKTTNYKKISRSYDLIKLATLTSPAKFNYKKGIFIDLPTGNHFVGSSYPDKSNTCFENVYEYSFKKT